MIPIPTNFYSTSNLAATASMNWLYNTFYTSSVTSPSPGFRITVNGNTVYSVTGSVGLVLSGSITCYQGDTVAIYVSGSNQSNRYTLSTLNVVSGSTTIANVQRSMQGFASNAITVYGYEFVNPKDASTSFVANADGVYIITGSNYYGVNPTCCVNTTTNGSNLFTYQYLDCNGNAQGITGAGLTVCARYASMGGVQIKGSPCGGACY